MRGRLGCVWWWWRVVMMIIMLRMMLLRRGIRLIWIMLMLRILHIGSRRGWWWLMMLTVKSAGFIAGRLANRNNIADCGLIFALYKVLHNLGGRLGWLGGFGPGRLQQRLAAALGLG
jgi:hypothetical protein